MKRIMVVGVGAQGSTIAKRMNEHPGVSEIICADYDFKAAKVLSDSLDKARALQLDAREVPNVIKAAHKQGFGGFAQQFAGLFENGFYDHDDENEA